MTQNPKTSESQGLEFRVSGVGALGYADMERSYLYPNLGLGGS